MRILTRGDAPDRFAVYALRYGRRAGVRGEHFLGWDPSADQPHDTAYYAWLALSSDRTVLVDSGIDPALELPLEGWSSRTSVPALLAELGVDAVDTLVLTHLHYDHAGGVRSFPDAVVHVQEAELAYWNSAEAKRVTREAWLVDQRDLAHLAAGARVQLSAGDVSVAPGLSAHLVGGHTAGMQVVRVTTGQGQLVLASDASHFYENLETDRPGTLLHHMPDVYLAFDRVRELAGGGPIIPGHDPDVHARFASSAGELPTQVVRLA